MPVEQAKWTLDSLQAHVTALLATRAESDAAIRASDNARIDERFSALAREIDRAHLTSARAMEVSNNSAEKWRENANEWRGSMTDRERHFATVNDVNALKERMDKMEGSGHGMQKLWGWIVAALMLVIALFGVKLK